MTDASIAPIRNHLLARIDLADLEALRPLLELVELGERMPLESPNRPADYVYFLEAGVSSIVARIGGQEIEVGLAGYDGMIGSTVMLGTKQTTNSVFMQVAGKGYRLRCDALLSLASQSASLRQVLLQYNYTLMVQAQATALVNGRAKLENRLARWLLMVHDRIAGDRLNLTHEFLSIMLGVRRPGVTVGLHLLEGQGLISSMRREIQIRDRPGLIKFAAESYGLPEREYARLLGDFRAVKAVAGS